MAFIDKNSPILVTGASGYIASWIIKLLIEDGYTVHGTVRNLQQTEKTDHLLEVQKNSTGKLKLFEADLMDEGSFAKAMADCALVIHTASPFFVQGVKDAQEQLIKPAQEGTRNVLDTVNETTSVKRVVLTSSLAALYGDAIDIKNTRNGTFDEKSWNTTSSVDHQPYSYSKTVAEKEAWRMVNEQERWDLLVINPGFVMGPSLSKRVESTSIDFMLSMVNGKFAKGMPDLYFGIVDVRDVAQAHINAGLMEKASGRHVTMSDTLSTLEIADKLREKFGEKYKIAKSTAPNFLLYLVGPFMGFPWKFLRRNLGIAYAFDNSYTQKDLNLTFRPVEVTLSDHVEQLERDGLI